MDDSYRKLAVRRQFTVNDRCSFVACESLSPTPISESRLHVKGDKTSGWLLLGQ